MEPKPGGVTEYDPVEVIADHKAHFIACPTWALLRTIREVGTDRRGTGAILLGVIEYLARDPSLNRTEEWLKAKSCLASLAVALEDAEEGKASPLLAVKRNKGRQPLTDLDLAPHNYAVITLELLERTGLDRKSAADRIARRLQKLGVRTHSGGHRITAGTIRSWRAAMDLKNGKSFDERIVREMLERVEFPRGAEPETLRANLLEILEAAVLAPPKAADKKS